MYLAYHGLIDQNAASILRFYKDTGDPTWTLEINLSEAAQDEQGKMRTELYSFLQPKNSNETYVFGS